MSFIARRLDSRDIRVFECTAVKGDVYYVTVDQTGFSQADISAIAVYVEGEAEATRVSGERSPEYPEVYLRKVGDSNLDLLPSYVQPGRIKYTVLSDTYKYYCVEDPKRRPLEGVLHSLKAGETRSPKPGRTVFLALGDLADSYGNIHSAPTLLAVENENVVLTAGSTAGLCLLVEVTTLA